MSGEEARWTGWLDWLSALGQAAPEGKRIAVNNYMIALQMAQDGVGAVLGRDELIRPLLARGALVDVVAERIPSPHAFWLKVHPRASAEARAFRDWLVARQD